MNEYLESEHAVRLRCNNAMGWDRWAVDPRIKVAPLAAWWNEDQVLAHFSNLLCGYRAVPGSAVWQFRYREFLRTVPFAKRVKIAMSFIFLTRSWAEQ